MAGEARRGRLPGRPDRLHRPRRGKQAPIRAWVRGLSGTTRGFALLAVRALTPHAHPSVSNRHTRRAPASSSGRRPCVRQSPEHRGAGGRSNADALPRSLTPRGDPPSVETAGYRSNTDALLRSVTSRTGDPLRVDPAGAGSKLASAREGGRRRAVATTSRPRQPDRNGSSPRVRRPAGAIVGAGLPSFARPANQSLHVLGGTRSGPAPAGASRIVARARTPRAKEPP